MVARLFCGLMGHVKTDVVQSVYLHLLVYGACHDVTWCERQPFVVFLHEGLAVGQFQYAAIASHRLGDEVGRVCLFRIMQYGGVKLHELHICHRTFGAIDHGDTIASGYHGVRRGEIYRSASTGTHHGDFRQIGIYLLCVGIEHVCSVTLDVW